MSERADVSRDEAELLSFLVDDHYGLWEVVCILKGDRTVARSILAALLARGWIELSRQELAGQHVPLSASDAVESLGSEAAWQVDGEMCFATTTPAGDAAHSAIPREFWAEHRRGG